MKKMVFAAVIWAVLAPFTAGAEAGSSRLSVVIPPDRAIVESELISVVLRLGDEAPDQVQISVNNRKLPPVKKPYYQNYAFKDGVQLSYGTNRISVTGLKDGRKTGEVNLQVFYKSDLSQSSGTTPPGFSKYTFHVASHEKDCSLCHQLDFRKNDSKKADSGERSPCFTCHKKKLDSYAFVHGPTAVWSCLTCHDATSRNPKMAVRQPVGKTCMECHENAWSSMKFQHGPTAAGDCTACHDPHASNQPNLLRLSAGDLCIACHEEVLLRPHVLSGFSGNGGHPVRRFPDPYNPGREFNCASCHNPHAGDSPRFLKGYDSSQPLNRFCLNCHRM